MHDACCIMTGRYAVTKGFFSEITIHSRSSQSAALFAFGLHAEAAWTPVSGAGSGAGGFPVDRELTVRSAGIGPHVRLFIYSSLFISPNYNSTLYSRVHIA